MNRYSVGILFAVFISFVPPAGAAEKETIAVIGTGDLGDSIGGRLAELGYKVVYGSRTPNSDRVKAVLVKTGHGATAASQKEAARQGDIVFVPINRSALAAVAKNLGNLDGKIVVDPIASWTQDDDGYPQLSVETSSAELIQQWNPGAKVVKAFGTMGSMIIDNPNAAGGLVTIPIASNHRDAKERVALLAGEMGLDPVDFGPLRMARLIETMAIIYMIPLIRHQDAEWEFYFRRNTDWVCRFKEEWAAPVYDADNLATMPSNHEQIAACPG
jgi:predicted dinucleotide-binding enzyme